MKKKFKRLVEKETAAKVKRRRIISAFLAAFMFVSGGSFGKIAQVGSTAVAEDLYDEESPPELEEDNDNTDEEDRTDNDTEQEDEPTDEDYDADDNAEQEDEWSDGEDEMTDEEGSIEFDDVTLAEIDIAADVPKDKRFEIRIKPQKDLGVDVLGWETNSNYNTLNFPYIAREAKDKDGNNLYDWNTVTVCGVTTNITEDANCTAPANEKHIKYTESDGNVTCFHPNRADGVEMYLLDDNCTYPTDYLDLEKNNILSILRDMYGYEVVEETWNYWDNGDQKATKKVLRVYMDIKFNGDITQYNAVTSKVVFNDGTTTDYTDWQQLYVSFRPEDSYIQVYSEVMNRDMNHVNEYVNDANLSNSAKRHVKGTTIENSEDTPYLLLNGDSVFIRGTNGKMLLPSGGNTTNVDTSGLTIKTWQQPDRVANATAVNDTKNNENDFIKLTVNGNVNDVYYLDYKSDVKDYDGKYIYDRFYFKIYDNRPTNAWTHGCWDHSDIEIADGGTYKIETEKFDESNKKYIEVVEYDIDVTDVNKCEIYGGKTTDQDNKPSKVAGASPLTIKNQYWDSCTEKERYKNIIETIEAGKKSELSEEDQKLYDALMANYTFPREMDYIPASDYWKDPSMKPGDDQFELTSKYKRNDGGKDANGDYKQGSLILESIQDNLVYGMDKVGGAKFYLQLLLTPKKVIRYEVDNDGNKNEETATDVTTEKLADYTNLTISNAEVDMSYQSVLDAFNKCPDHSGLDFTLKSDFNEVISINPIQEQIRANKVLKNKDLEAGQFSFQLYYIPNDGAEPDKIGDPVTNASLVNDGVIIFPMQTFVSVGTYKYQIREVKGNDDSIEYDDKVIDVTIVVINENDSLAIGSTTYTVNGKEVAPTFTNTFKVQYYTLPSAGGPGVYIYIISGVGFMLAAAVMFYRKRRKEA